MLNLLLYNTFMLILLRLGYIYTKHNFFDINTNSVSIYNYLFIWYFSGVLFSLYRYEKQSRVIYFVEMITFIYLYIYSYNLVNIFHIKLAFLMFFFLSLLTFLFNLSLRVGLVLVYHFLLISFTLIYLFSKNKYLIFMSYNHFFYSSGGNNLYNFFLNNNKYMFFKLSFNTVIYKFRIDQLSLNLFNKSTIKNNIFIIF